MRRRPRIVRISGAPAWLTETRITAKGRAGRHAIGDTVVVIADGRVMRGMVLEELPAHEHWFSQLPRSFYVVQVGPEPEDGHTVCVCQPTVENSDPSPLCGAIHADTVDLDGVELYFQREGDLDV